LSCRPKRASAFAPDDSWNVGVSYYDDHAFDASTSTRLAQLHLYLSFTRPSHLERRLSCFTVAGLQAAALKPRIDPGGHLGPQIDLDGEQRVNFQTAQLPPLFIQLRERSPRRASEIVPQLFIRQQTADHSFDRSM
jgi:hypothetical protein